MVSSIISVHGAEKLLKKCGARRVSQRAAEEFAYLIEIIAEKIGKEIVNVSQHANRITIKEEDVKFVLKHRIKDVEI